MLISKEVEKIEGVQKALVGMGTDLNKELAENLNIINDEIRRIGPNDFFVTLLADGDVKLEHILGEIDGLLNQNKRERDSDYMPPTLNAALAYEPESNLVLISVAGEYAATEAKKALEKNCHVMIFSDNVSLTDEKELKRLAVEKGLLMMGPDCGTAIINNIPLAFANDIRKGDIGIVGASGTGTQEVSVIIDNLGAGVSQVIGTGGRDLHEEIGGLMMLQGIDALAADPNTKVIVLISKPPSENVAKNILKTIQNIDKPVVIDFIGGDKQGLEKYGAYVGISLEDTARKAVALSRGKEIVDFEDFNLSGEEIHKIVEKEVTQMSPEQKYLRGLFTGGTLAVEAMHILGHGMGPIYSNVSAVNKIKDIEKSQQHTCIDFGEDELTVGKPHPMIDAAIRNQRLLKEATDGEVAVVLMDFVLGYGAHEDPIREALPMIVKAKRIMKQNGKHLCVVAAICGTDKDPQNVVESQKNLEAAGVIVMPTNAQAVRLVGLILSKLMKERDKNVQYKPTF